MARLTEPRASRRGVRRARPAVLARPAPRGCLAGDEEYSRVTDPERYRIVHARGRAWADVLAGLPGVEEERIGPSLGARAGRFDRGVRLVPAAAGTLPLVLLEYGAEACRARERSST